MDFRFPSSPEADFRALARFLEGFQAGHQRWACPLPRRFPSLASMLPLPASAEVSCPPSALRLLVSLHAFRQARLSAELLLQPPSSEQAQARRHSEGCLMSMRIAGYPDVLQATMRDNA